MSKVFKNFKEHLFKSNNFTKLFAKQTPGKRIAPAQAKNNDAEFQLRSQEWHEECLFAGQISGKE